MRVKTYLDLDLDLDLDFDFDLIFDLDWSENLALGRDDLLIVFFDATTEWDGGGEKEAEKDEED